MEDFVQVSIVCVFCRPYAVVKRLNELYKSSVACCRSLSTRLECFFSKKHRLMDQITSITAERLLFSHTMQMVSRRDEGKATTQSFTSCRCGKVIGTLVCFQFPPTLDLTLPKYMNGYKYLCNTSCCPLRFRPRRWTRCSTKGRRQPCVTIKPCCCCRACPCCSPSRTTSSVLANVRPSVSSSHETMGCHHSTATPATVWCAMFLKLLWCGEKLETMRERSPGD